MKLNEQSEFTIPLKNLLGLLSFTAIAVWAYFSITERINFLEHKTQMQTATIQANENWINGFQPPATVQETVKLVRSLEKQLEVVKIELKYLKSTVYQ